VAIIVRGPAAVGVMLTEQLALFAVGVPNVHVPLGVKLTVPDGAVAPVVVESVTVAVQDVAWSIAVVVRVQDTVVVVGCAAGCEMLTVALPVLVAWVVSPG